jgi:enamine deaminase RidA (YjgF/YER057c/UK114 family)
VSGTTSIAPGGQSVHKDDITAQVNLSLDVIEALLLSRGLDFSDATRATAYLKTPRHANSLDDWFKPRGVWFPAVRIHAGVCRDDLLFELELDAIMEKPVSVAA